VLSGRVFRKARGEDGAQGGGRDLEKNCSRKRNLGKKGVQSDVSGRKEGDSACLLSRRMWVAKKELLCLQ